MAPMAPSARLSLRALNRATLARQGLLEALTGPPGEAVRQVGSLQAQHPEWPPVALASRAADPRTADLAGALTGRTAVRSSLMRITIHVVSSDDLWPMFTVMQPMRADQWRRILKRDPTDSELGRRLTNAHQVAIDALRERPRSSLELDRLLSAAVGLDKPAATRPAWRRPESQLVVRTAWRHFAAFVPLVHVPHDGEGYGRSKYALAADWLGVEPPQIDDVDARIHVARRYLGAFGPATIQDLAAYVGRGKGGIRVWREAIDRLADEVVELRGEDGRALLDLTDAPRPSERTPAPPRLLARWDSLLLSHATRERERVIAEAHRPRVFSKNADVLPTFLVDGFVAGTWQLERTDGAAAITLRPFPKLRRDDAAALEAEADRLLRLMGEASRTVRFAP
jgi:hypothetical protein